jgi:anti-anti-sigma factor
MDDDARHESIAGSHTISFDTNLYEHLAELVVCCDAAGYIHYSNRAAQRLQRGPLEGVSFFDVLVPDSAEKGREFFDVARAASIEQPTEPWELSLGTPTDYTVASFRGYSYADTIVLFAHMESDEMRRMQHDMLALTSELADAQRKVQRQNRKLQQALEEQQHLLHTIQELTAPIAPITDQVLLLPLVGHIDSLRAEKITEAILERVTATHARYVILDISSIAVMDTAVARHMLDTAAAIRLLGARAVLVGVNPAIAETIVHLGIDLHGFILQSDLQHAITYVLHRRNGRH